MNRPWLRHVLMESGICIDRARLLDWVLARRLNVAAFRYFRLRFSPAVLEDALKTSMNAEEAGRLFSLAMSFINVRDTYKTTGDARTVLADEALLQRAREFSRPAVLEVGASDGSASTGILCESDGFSRILLTDRHNLFHVREFPGGKLFLDSEKRVLGIKILCFYLAFPSAKSVNVRGCREIKTVNPLVSARFGVRTIDRFDMFTDTLDRPVELIRCSNILNASYFTNEQIVEAVRNLMQSLVAGGYLVISHNNARYAEGEALLSLRKTATGFSLADDRNEHELRQLLAAEGAA